MKQIIAVISAIIAVIFSGVWLCFSSNVETPAGYVGYITQGSFFGQSKYINTQTGPISSGRHWLYKGVNVSVTPYNEDEVWKSGGDIILAKDKLPLLVDAHIIWKIKPDRIKDFMENYGGLASAGKNDNDVIESQSYKNYIRSPFRNIVRDEISKYNGLEINEHLPDISKDIYRESSEKFKDSPFEIISTVVGNCAPPEAVTNEIAKKVAATQELQRKQTELEIAQKKEEIQRAEGRAAAAMETETARGKAAAMEEIKKQLTPEYLTYEAIRGFNGANRVYIPLGGNGLPIVGNMDIGLGVDNGINSLLPNPPPNESIVK